ncbi:DUF4181 domain-containing protein [Rossellomorea aquimaris]
MLWIKYGLIAIIVFVFISMINFLLGKFLNIEKARKELFSYNHINQLHRKVDNWIKHISVITLIILLYVLLFYYEDLTYLFLIAVVFFHLLDYAVRGYFEWKYSEYPKQAILTFSEMTILFIAFIIVIRFYVLGSY